MRLLVTGAWKATAEQLEQLRGMGHEVILQPQESEPLACTYDEIEGTICNGLFLYHEIEKFTNLKFIQLTSAGYDRVPMDYVQAHRIEIHNARGVYSIPMAEHTLAGVLALYRRLPDFLALRQRCVWKKYRDLEELNGRTALVLGCGNVGTEVAKHFRAFNCHVIGVDIVPIPNSQVFQEFFLLKDLDSLLPLADIIVLTLPLTDTTRHLINAQRLSLLKDHSVVVNIARGAVIDFAALIAELASNRLRAVLDVFEEEPLPVNSPLWHFDNVLLTPHVSFVGGNDLSRLNQVIFGNLEQKL